MCVIKGLFSKAYSPPLLLLFFSHRFLAKSLALFTRLIIATQKTHVSLELVKFLLLILFRRPCGM